MLPSIRRLTPTCQPYLSNSSIPMEHRATTARFRCNNHWLAVHTSRYARAAERKRLHNTPCRHCEVPTWAVPNYMLFCDSCNSCWHCQCLQPPSMHRQQATGTALPALPLPLVPLSHARRRKPAPLRQSNAHTARPPRRTLTISFSPVPSTQTYGNNTPTCFKGLPHPRRPSSNKLIARASPHSFFAAIGCTPPHSTLSHESCWLRWTLSIL